MIFKTCYLFKAELTVGSVVSRSKAKSPKIIIHHHNNNSLYDFMGFMSVYYKILYLSSK